MNRVISPLTLIAAVLLPAASSAQFTSGSNGTDGALNVAGMQGPVSFDPVAQSLDADDDGVYHFTTITIGAGTTVLIRADRPRLVEGRPVIWLASGAVSIEGTVSLDGENGHHNSSVARRSIPGAGGFGGTAGGANATGGGGPGGGLTSNTNGNSWRAGHTLVGGSGAGGQSYGNVFLMPLIGGSKM